MAWLLGLPVVLSGQLGFFSSSNKEYEMMLIAIFVATVVGFLAGALVFRKHGDRIEADAAKVSAVVQNVSETTKSL